VEYARGFSLIDYGNYKILEVRNPYPEADKSFTYLLAEEGAKIPARLHYDEKISIPVHKIVVTSTTHIPSLVSLGEINSLVGFPHLDFISSPQARQRIDAGKVKELGENEHLNTEILLSLRPDVLIGFTMKGGGKIYQNIEKAGIPVVFNGDWNEKNPLGKAEWIKFFGAFYQKDKEAAEIFNRIKNEYESAKKIAQKASNKPTVLAGGMFKDVWYLPTGDSWVAHTIADAGGDYLYKNTSGTGSLSRSIESVLDKAQHADYWISPSGFTRYKALKDASRHYTKFDAFQNKHIYTYGGVKGETGGLLFFELAPNRPDIVLKDLIHIFHPELLPDYKNTFYKPMQ